MKEFLTSDYLSPVINLISIVATITALFFTWYQIVELKKEKIEDALYEQSSKIAVWNSVNPISGTDDFTNVRISNDTSLPIYNVFIFMPLNVSTDLESDLKLLIKEYYFFHADVIPPEKTDVFVQNSGAASGQKFPVPCIFFTDSQNNEWFRDKNGKLEPYKDYEKDLVELGVTYPLPH